MHRRRRWDCWCGLVVRFRLYGQPSPSTRAVAIRSGSPAEALPARGVFVLSVMYLCVIAAVGCDEGSTAAPVPDGGVAPRPRICAASDQAPLRVGDGGFACTMVGAVQQPGNELWPTVPAGAVARFVRPDADEGGDGSRERPWRRLGEALRGTPVGVTVVLSRGTHPLSETLTLPGDATVVGVGSDPMRGSVIDAPPGVQLFAVPGAATLRALAITHAGTATGDVATVSVAASGALRLEDVALRRPAIGVLCAGRLDAAGLTVLEAGRVGVGLVAGARANLRNVLIRDGQGVGIQADGAHLHLGDALVHENARGGVYLNGTTSGDPMGGAASCTVDGPGTTPGPLDCIDHASITCNGIAGLAVSGAGGAGAAQRAVEVRSVALSGTSAPAGMPGGDGLVVQDGVSVSLDPGTGAMGGGSEVVGNARLGVLVQGVGAVLRMRGATVASNAGPGVFVTAAATVQEIRWSEVAFNRGLGVGVATSSSIMSLTDSVVRDTSVGSLPGMSASVVMVGDGVSAAGAVVGTVARNELSRNERFAAAFSNSSGVVEDNRGSDNRYAIGAYEVTAAFTERRNVFVRTRAATPASADVARQPF